MCRAYSRVHPVAATISRDSIKAAHSGRLKLAHDGFSAPLLAYLRSTLHTADAANVLTQI